MTPIWSNFTSSLNMRLAVCTNCPYLAFDEPGFTTWPHRSRRKDVSPGRGQSPLSTSISATAAPYDVRCVPTPMPRPVATLALDNCRRLARRPLRKLRYGIEHAQPAYIRHVPLPKFVGVCSKGRRVDQWPVQTRTERKIERRAQPSALEIDVPAVCDSPAEIRDIVHAAASQPVDALDASPRLAIPLAAFR